MRTKLTARFFGFLNLVIVFIMVFGLLGSTPLHGVQASQEQASKTADTPPVGFDPAGMPYDDAQRQPYSLPDSAQRFERPAPAVEHSGASSAYRPDRLPAVLEDLEQPALHAPIPPATLAGISSDADYGFWVDPNADFLQSWGFPANADITLTVGTSTFVRTSDENGICDWGDLGHDFIVGETITLVSGSFTKSHKVQKLALTSLDQALDIVKGTSKPGAVVNVGALDAYDNWISVDVTANTEGVFKAKMGVAGVDLVLGTSGNIGRWDSDGDGTVINWQILNPHIRVYPDKQDIFGFNWWPATPVNLSIDGVSYGSAVSDPWGYVEFRDITESLSVGRVIVMTDGKTSRTHQITGMSFDLIDPVNDTVSGTASNPGFVKTYAWSPVGDVLEDVDTTADSAGKWTAQYSIDIVPGSDGGARQFDGEGNQSVYYWYLPNPGFEVKPEEDTVWGWEWPALTEIKLTVNGDEYFRTSKENGDVDFNDLERDIVVGDIVEMSAGAVNKAHKVHYLTVENADVDTDTLSGYTDPGASIGTWVCTNGDCQGIGADSDPATGYWEVNYTGVIDIIPGSDGGVHLFEDDNTATMVYWRAPDPIFSVNLNQDYVSFQSWASFTTLTLSVDGKDLTTIETDFNGNAFLGDVDIQPGSTVSVSDGTLTKQTFVENLTLTGVDQFADWVSGTADPAKEIIVATFDQNWQQTGIVTTTADSAGNWSADFSGVWDITVGTKGFPAIFDDDGDYTEVGWEIPIPWFEINIVEDAIWGGNWTPGSAVTVTAGAYTSTLTADEGGNVGFGFMDFDLAPGDYVEMTDGTTTKSLTAYNLAFTAYDLALDTLTGTTDPGTWAHAVICSDGGCNDIYDYEVEDGGVVSFDFSGIVDIQPGTEGWFDKWDEDGDNTVVTWRIPNPRVSINLLTSVIYANGWPAFADLTLKVNTSTFYATVDFWGRATFEDLGIEITPGDLIEMTDGDTTKNHTVPLLEVTDVNWDLDKVTGNTDPDTEIMVSAEFPDGSGNSTLWVTSDELGRWYADFSGIVDIVPGTNGWVALFDEDYDVSWVDWHVRAPRFGVNLNWDYIWGNEWVPGSTVTVNVRGIDVTTATVHESGIVDIGIAEFNILPGDTVTVRDDLTTKSLVVRNLALTRVDDLTDQVSGTADPGTEISTWAELGDGGWHDLYTIADGSGKWVADFAGIGVDLHPGDYGYVNIREDDGDFTEVRWDVEAPFYPAYLEKLTTSKVAFDWEDTLGATAYKIQLSTKSNFSTLLFSAASVDSVYPYATKLTNNTTYFWRVKAKVNGVWSGWKPVWQFTSMDPLAKPVLTWPANGVTLHTTAGLDWEPVTNGFTYLVQISKLADFSTTYFKTTTDKTEFMTNPLPKGKYFWRVRAIDASGGKGPWSEVRWFKIVVP